jgi:hypothetical protein
VNTESELAPITVHPAAINREQLPYPSPALPGAELWHRSTNAERRRHDHPSH